ncbi:GPI-anchored CFEM domain protein [Colletotrichum sp. SAR 10_86]|nr:GPI-anchored CFEM domain protein [Colletotrichum siamense]KAI8204570.1 GPI-anchored CFEM domain protein [Colletotrichum sp. SAR 10_76]KAI8224585.1 GPI-anchored CFEM domain protein [Colletotrichum sp. SAR 10_77]KAI8225111.1 GPI-anchored CFEM domain protein [Colletotrichum sp. SAR 10_86]KAJ4998346.1 GPI-anchored CFEM domain protein [Colletotrichum sp. SAR 10_66]
MKYTIITAFLAAFAAAKTVDELVADIPTCAVTCIRDAATSVNCDISDFACSCAKQDQLTPVVVNCLSKSSCSADDQTKVLLTAQQICSQVSSGVSATGSVGALASGASSTGTGTGTATASSTGAAAASTSSPAAAPTMHVAGWAGALAAAAALAL